MPRDVEHGMPDPKKPPGTEPTPNADTRPIRARSSSPELSRWVIEILSFLVSLTSFGALLIILIRFNGRPLQEWPSSRISLNTVIAVSSLLSRTSLVLPLANGLSQLKWLWFRKGPARQLIDLHRFDEASRGPWGAIQLLGRGVYFPLAPLGAFVLAMTLTFEPFVQQTVTFPIRYVESSDSGLAEVPVSTYWDGNVDSSFLAAGYDALLSPNISKTSSAISPICRTGNCTFEPYTSLGVCSQCVDVSSALSFSRGDVDEAGLGNNAGCHQENGTCEIKITAPNGLSMQYYVANVNSKSSWDNPANGMSIMNTSTTSPLMSHLLDAQTLTYAWLSNFTIIARTVPTPSAFDCVFSMCTKQYEGNVTNGIFRENVVKTAMNVSNIDQSVFPWNTSGVVVGHVDLNFNLTVPLPDGVVQEDHQQSFHVGFVSSGDMGSYLRDRLGGNIVSTAQYANASYEPSFPFSDYMQGIWEHGIHQLPQTVDGLAETLTNNMRQLGESARGRVVQSEPYIHVRYPWLILPLGLEMLGLAFLAGVVAIMSGSGLDPWKTSVLAPVLHGPLLTSKAGEPPHLDTNSGMEEFAVDARTRLLADGEGLLRLQIVENHQRWPHESRPFWKRLRHALAQIPGICLGS